MTYINIFNILRTILVLFRPAFFATFVASGCTYVPFDAPRTEAVPSQPRPAVDTKLDRAIAASGGQSMFVGLVNGNDALGARLRMIESATYRIDLQSFLIKPDQAGSLISLALLTAAERGVAIRLLFDDVFSTVSDDQLALLASHPMIDVRLFNPLSRNSTKAMNYILDFSRVNRRMHNKLFLVDDQIGIIGGRNIADEYYQIKTDSEFADFETFVAGPVVADLTETFLTYWSDKWSVPVEALRPENDPIDPDVVTEVLRQRADKATVEIYQQAVNSTYLADLRAGRIEAVPGNSYVITDAPSKLKTPIQGGDRPLAETLLQQMATAQTDITIVTPYFVPEDWGADFLIAQARRGITVRVVTNSLAATNHPYVHAGYIRHRAALLAAGVELYEIRADAPQVLGTVPKDSKARLTMHTKLALIDDRVTVISSLNFDPRSIKLNSEGGLFITNTAITRSILNGVAEDLASYTYRLSLTPNGRVQWTYDNGTLRQQVFEEPSASFLQKLLAGLTMLLPIEGQL